MCQGQVMEMECFRHFIFLAREAVISEGSGVEHVVDNRGRSPCQPCALTNARGQRSEKL